MNILLTLLKKADLAVSYTARTLCVISLAAIFAMFLANVFLRFVPVFNLTQTDDWTQFFLIWMIFLGAQELVRLRGHFVVDALSSRWAGTRRGALLRVLVCTVEVTTYAVICWYGWVWVMRANAVMQTVPWMQMRWVYAAIPVSAFFMTCYGIRDWVQAACKLLRRR